MMLDGFLNAARGRSGRGLWVPGGGPPPPPPPGVGPGANEPAGMTAVIQATFTTLPPAFPTVDANGFGFNGSSSQLSIVTEGADTFLRGNTPAAKQQIGNSDWWLLSATFPANTGVFYSRQRIRFSANHRMDCAFRIKFMSPKLPGGVSNNHLMLARGTTAVGAKDPVGQGQQMSWSFLTQAGAPVGSIQYGAATNFLITPDGLWHDMEYLITPGTPGVADSVMDLWWDGALMWHQTGIIMQNTGLTHEVISLDQFANPSTLAPNPGLMNTTDSSGDITAPWQDQQVDFDWWYASVEAV